MQRTFLLLAFVAGAANAAPMQLNHLGRLLDTAGTPINGVHTLTFRIVDGAGTAWFTESFPGLNLQDGYYGVTLGAGATTLDTGVFLDHGEMSLEIDVDGATTLTGQRLGGYPLVVARQALLATEASVQQIAGRVGAYSQTCSDWAATGWASQDDCLHDGRWHLVYRNSDLGTIADLKAHILAGAEVRVVTNVNPASWDCASVSFLDRRWGDGSVNVACHAPQTSHPGPYNLTNSASYWSTYELWTNGTLTFTERQSNNALFTGTWDSSVVGEWYVRY